VGPIVPRSLGIDLSIDFDVHSDNGFESLEAALKAHGLSDYPVIATIEGNFTPDRYDSIRRRKRTVIVVRKVKGIRQSSARERR
jgi:hypothetical protein